MPSIADSNWLLSTLVQSAAALVAIVGGLLITRLVSLSAEREGLRRRVTDLEGARVDHMQRANEADAAWLQLDVEAFLGGVHKSVIGTFGKLDFETAFVAEDPQGRTAEELRGPFEAYCAQINDLARNLVARHGESRPAGWGPDAHDGEVLATPHEHRDLVDDILHQLERTLWAPPPTAFDVSALMPIDRSVYAAADRSSRQRRYDDTVRDAQQAARLLADARRDLEAASRELARLGKPEGLSAALGVLVGIALTGIVFPLAVMANGAYELPPWLRIAHVVTFVGALVAFMGFLRSEIRRATGRGRAAERS